MDSYNRIALFQASKILFMKNLTIFKIGILLQVCLYLCISPVKSQCTFTSTTTGGKVTIGLYPVAIVAPTTCPYGYNYNVTYRYRITYTGTVNLYTLQGSASCGIAGHAFSLPTTGPGSGQVTSNLNPYRVQSDCGTASVSSLGCITNPPSIFINGDGFGNLTFNCPYENTILPVTLLSFDAKTVHNKVNFKWVTVREVNNQKYELQSSSNMDVWKTVYEAAGSVNSSETKAYTYTDEVPYAGTVYYRLKQTDLDGKTTYSYTIAVKAIVSGQQIQVASNPGKGKDLLVSGLGNAGHWKVSITDMAGRPFSQALQATGNLNLPDQLPNGFYLLQFANEKTGEKQAIKYLKQ